MDTAAAGFRELAQGCSCCSPDFRAWGGLCSADSVAGEVPSGWAPFSGEDSDLEGVGCGPTCLAVPELPASSWAFSVSMGEMPGPEESLS